MKRLILASALYILHLSAYGETNTPLPIPPSGAGDTVATNKECKIDTAWLGISLSVIALGLSIWTWRRLYENTKYDVADNLLQEIHKIELQHPEYCDPALCELMIKDKDQLKRLRYDAFATIVWNYLETLYDKYGHRKLKKSPFYGSMRCLATRHRAWLFSGDNLSSYNENLPKFLRIEK